jgi:hypothetical protein
MLLAGCAESGPLTLADDVQPLLDESCLCHMEGSSGTMVAPTLTLNADSAFAELVDTPSTQLPSMARVTPGDPDASYLWRKITDTHIDAGGSGTVMPPTGQLSAGKRDTIEMWIADGAQP